MLHYFLAQHKIFGKDVEKREEIKSSVRFSIAIGEEEFGKFVDKLMGALFEVEYQQRNLLSRL